MPGNVLPYSSFFSGEKARGETEKIETLKYGVCFRETLSPTVLSGSCSRDCFSIGGWSLPAGGVSPWEVSWPQSPPGCVAWSPTSAPAKGRRAWRPASRRALCFHSSLPSFAPTSAVPYLPALPGVSQENGPFPLVTLTGHNPVGLSSQKIRVACRAGVCFSNCSSLQLP